MEAFAIGTFSKLLGVPPPTWPHSFLAKRNMAGGTEAERPEKSMGLEAPHNNRFVVIIPQMRNCENKPCRSFIKEDGILPSLLWGAKILFNYIKKSEINKIGIICCRIK